MSYVNDSLWEYQATVVTGTPLNMSALPAHQANTVLLALVLTRSGAGTVTTPSGWTKDSEATNGGIRLGVYYLRAASSSETPPSWVCSSSNAMAVHVFSIEDAPTSGNPLDLVAYGSLAAGYSATIAGGSTTVNDCLLLRGFGYNSATYRSIFLDGELTRESVNGDLTTAQFGLVVGSAVQRTAGAVPSVTAYNTSNSIAGNSVVVAVKNKTGGAIQPVATQSPVRVAYWEFETVAAHPLRSGLWSWADLTTVVGSTLGGITVGTDYTLGNAGHGQTTDIWPNLLTIVSDGTTNTPRWVGAFCVLTSTVDVSDAVFAFQYGMGLNRLNTGNVVTLVIFVDNSGNWAAYPLRPRTQIVATSLYQHVIDVENVTPVYSSGTLDPTTIKKIGFAYYKTNSTSVAGWQIYAPLICKKASPTIAVGGAAVQPLSGAWLNKLTAGLGLNTLVEAQGVGQITYKIPLQLGDGTLPTYVDLSGNSLEQRRQANANLKLYDYAVPAGSVGLVLKACATCTFKIKQGILASNQTSYLTWDAASNASATYDTSAFQFRNSTVIWNSDVPANAALFAISPEVDCKAGTFTSCTWDMQTDTYAAKLDDGAELLNCVFNTATPANYALRIPAAGTYNLDGTTFTGYTTAIHVTATTGTVTLHLALGDTVPTYTTAGATVVIDQAVVQATASVIGLVAGSRIQIYNVTTATEKINAVQAGTSYSLDYDDGTEYSDGDVIRVRVCGPVGATAYNEAEYTAVATSGGWTVLAAQTAGVIYNAAGINGTTVTEFAPDYPNIQVDINDPDGTTSVQRLHAWWMANLFTESGIRDFFGGFIAEDAVNFKIVTSVVDIKLDNIQTTPLLLVGARIYRDDGTTVIASDSGPLHIDPEKAYAVETGVSGLTPTESGQLAEISSVKNIVEADEIHTGTTVQKRLKGTSTVLLTKNHTGTPLVDLQVTQ